MSFKHKVQYFTNISIVLEKPITGRGRGGGRVPSMEWGSKTFTKTVIGPPINRHFRVKKTAIKQSSLD